MNPREEFVSVQEAADIMGLDRSRVGRLCREGRFPGATKIGTSWIIPRASVLNHKPLPPGVKSKKAKLAAELGEIRAAITETSDTASNGDYEGEDCHTLRRG